MNGTTAPRANFGSGQRLLASNSNTGIGYLSAKNGDVIDLMARNRVWAWAITPDTKIWIHPSYPVHILAQTAEDIIRSAHAVLLGIGFKSFTQAPVIAVASVVQNLSVALTTRAFGVRAMVYDAPLTYRPGSYHFALSDGAYSAVAGANLGEIYVSSPHNRVEIMMFAVQNTGGQASIIGLAVPTLTLVAADSATVAATATTTTVGISAETLNERDLAH